MALEQTTQDLAATELENETLKTGSHLDFSGVANNDPFDNFGGFNVDQIQKDQSQSFGNNPATKDDVGNQTTSQTTVKPPEKTDLNASYERLKARNKSYADNIGKKFVDARNPALAYGNYEFDQYTTNIDRYRGYGKKVFNEIGFNPLEENEDHFNANTTGWQDFKRMTGQWGTLFGSSFVSNYTSIYNFFSGNVSPIDPDVEAAREFEKAMALGSSTKTGGLDGAWGAATNFTLNTAYAAGIAANVIAEETVIWGLGLVTAPFTEGTSLAASAAIGTAEGAKAINNLRKLRMMYSSAFRGKEISQIGRGGMSILKSLGRADDAKAFWRMSRGGFRNLGEGAVGFFNPFRQGTEALSGIRANAGIYRNLSNFAKGSKTFGGFYRDMRENWFAVGESQLEGGSTFNDIVNKEIEIWQRKNNAPGQMPPEEELKRIYTDAEAGGKLTTLINIPMIFLSNRVVFDGLFNFKGVKSLTELSEAAFANGVGKKISFDLAGKTYKEVGKTAFGKFKTSLKVFRNPKVYAGTFLNYTKSNFMEGTQEILQEATAGSIKNYYLSLYANPSQGGNNLIKSSIYQSVGEDVFSMKGLETFMSGFLMGGAMSMAGGPLKSLGTGTKEYLWSKFKKESYKKYVAQKELMKTQAVEALNQMIADPEKFFGRRGESTTTQINSNENMVAAKMNNDDKGFYDAKDDKTMDHIFTALDNGTFGKLVEGMKELSTLSEDELADYFKLESGVKAKDKIQEYIARAEQIKERYDTIQEKFANPFNPTRFKKYKSSPGSESYSLYVREFIAHKAFEDAKKIAIASEYGFERAVERMAGTFTDLAKNLPLATGSASDFTVLQNENSIKSELKVLKGEITSLLQGGSDEKRLAKQKQAKYDVMAEYLDYLKKYNKEKESSRTEENGKVVVPYNEHLLDPLRDTFHKYVKVLAKMNNEINIFDDKINTAFDKISDYYSLNDDARRYNDVINYLSDPANLLRYADAAQETLAEIFNNRNEIVADAIEQYIGVHELNALMQVIGKMGVVINPADVEALYRKGKLPSSYFDLRTNKVIDRKDARYAMLSAMMEKYSKIVRKAPEDEVETPEEFQPEPTEEEKQAAEEEAKKKAEEEAAALAAQQAQTQPTTMDSELESRLRKAYDMYLVTGNPDVTFEEYVKNFGSAQRIKEEYEREKAAGKKPTTKAVSKYTDATTLEDKVEWIKNNTRIDRTAFNSDQEFVDYFESKRNTIIESIKDGKSKEDILTANGYVVANLSDINAEYSKLLKEYGIEEEAPPAPPAGPPAKTEAELAKEEAQALIDELTSLKDLPNLKKNDNKAITARILEMIAAGNLKSIDVLNMIEAKRAELAKNITINDLEEGDFITFTNGREGWIKSVDKDGTVKIKIIGSAKGEYATMTISEISKTISMLDEGKKVSPDPVEEVVITPDASEAIVASRDVMSEFVSNVAELQKINEENKNLTDNSSNINDLLNGLGCNTKPGN
jgi:hypothetical protein